MTRWPARKHRTEFESLEPRRLLAADPVISEFMAATRGIIQDGDGNASDWIEIANRGDADVDLSGWYLTDDATRLNKYPLPAHTLQPGQAWLVFASAPTDGQGGILDDYVDADGHPHANFRLSSNGEFLALVQPDGTTIASSFSPQYPEQVAGVSFGTDFSSGETGYFVAPTPGEPNGSVANGIVADTKFSFDRGFYDEPIDVQVTSATPGSAIVYTTDGSLPSADNGTVVLPTNNVVPPVASVRIESTTTLRAVAFKADHVPSNVDTHTYIFLNDVIRQPSAREDLPARWNGRAQSPIRADYEMDPDIVDDPAYTADLLKGLREIPTMSIVLDPEHMFGEEDGIYIHSAQRGRDWEHPTSVEIIEPDGTTFQTDSGIRIHGFSWRNHGNTPKHSFRLEFRDEYGPAKMDYPLFPDAPVDRFDSIVLRAQGGRAWAGLQNPAEAQYQRDTFARDLSREMGRVDGHATYVHLYINGLYWGLYNPVERPDAQMGAEYFGGSADDYDALNRRTSSLEVIDGDNRKYRAMLRIVNGALRAGETTDEDYAQLQRDIAIDEFIDFMIVNQYVTNRDGVTAFEGNNQRVIGSRVGDAQFRFFVWDMEYSMWNATDNNNVDVNRPRLAGSNNPANGSWAIYNALRQHPDFRIRYADRVQKHLFHDGALTPDNAAATWMERATSIQNAIVAESARWGDSKRSRPYTRDVEWRREQQRLLNSYFPRRSEILVGHLQEVGLSSTTPVPELQVNGTDQHGGKVNIGDTISLQQTGEQSELTKVLISDDSMVSAYVPSSDALDGNWNELEFVEGAAGETWTVGQNGVGFDNAHDYDRLINIDTEEAMRSNASVYIRIPFRIDDEASLTAITSLNLQMLVDDGFIAYLNGQPVASLMAPENPSWNSAAIGANEASVNNPLAFNLSSVVDQLVVGDNILAIHGMNFGTNSGDMIVHATLVAEGTSTDQIWYTTDGSDPRLPGGAISDVSKGGTAKLFTDDIVVETTTRVRARARSFDGNWSAEQDAFFVANTPVQITEINYNPSPPTALELATIVDLENDDFEFIELMNVGSAEINLNGMTFGSGVDFAFENDRLAPGELAVVVRNAAAFSLRYGNDVRVLGEYSGKLNNNGETLSLRLPHADADFITIEYNDNSLWPRAADGVGATLELVDAALSTELANKYYSWQPSSIPNGTPGAANSTHSGVVINEVLTNGGAGTLDAIELLNATGQVIDIGGWYLSDSASNLLKYEFPAGTTIPGNGYLVIDERAFNPTPQDPAANHFALSGTNGDDVWLVVGDNGNVTSFVDHVSFGSARTGESFGRLPNGIGRLFPTEHPSLGARNSVARQPAVVISEIHYNPAQPTDAALEIDELIAPSDLEFLELHNASDTVVALSDLRVRGGIDADFDTELSLQPNATAVVVRFDPARPDNAKRLAAFRSHHNLDENTFVVGGFSGRLSDNFDLVRLDRTMGQLITIEDEVVYDTESPWPVSPTDQVESLHRRTVSAYGHSAASWRSSEPTPGTVSFDSTLVGDFNADSIVDANDIDLLCRNLGNADTAFDLNGDQIISVADHDFLIGQVLSVIRGDANLDGVFNSSDLVVAFQHAQYEDDLQNNSGWASGDWNCDGDFTTSDLVIAFQSGRYVAASHIDSDQHPTSWNRQPIAGKIADAAFLDFARRPTTFIA